ncbi:MAG: hypothetical protein Q8P67_01400, partial [archaeon]|nr:hypothetical protein [archaeon]
DLPLFLINAGSDERSVVTLPLPRAPGMRRLFSYQTGDAPTLLVVLDDLTVTSYDVSAGKAIVKWSRAEGLATAFKAEFLDLPHHQSEEAATELELIQSGLASRIALHLDKLQRFLLPSRVRSAAESPHNATRPLLTSAFGFRKLVVVLSRHGRVFALDSEDGSVLWSRYFPCSQLQQVFVLRSPLHPQPRIAVLAKEGRHTLLSILNPLSALEVARHHLAATVAAATLTPDPLHLLSSSRLLLVDQSTRKCSVLSIDGGLQPYTSPPASAGGADFVHYALSPNLVAGYACDGRSVWHKKFLSSDEQGSAEVVVAAQAYHHTAPSTPYKVLGNGTMSTKYINPNKLLVATQWKSSQKRESHLNVYLLDTITGQELLHHSHKHGEEPVHLIQYQNWVGYQYWHAHAHRFELVSIELYAPSSLDYHGAFSSYDRLVPAVFSAAFIAPFPLHAMAVTDSLRGITPHHLITTTAGGRVVAIDSRILDPRRPLAASITEEQRAEELFPYHPEISLPSRAMLSYNLTLHGLYHVATAPTSVESTTLVFAYGLDLFSTRFAPAHQYDLLQEEFNKPLLVCTVIILLAVTIIANAYIQRKNLNHLWR